MASSGTSSRHGTGDGSVEANLDLQMSGLDINPTDDEHKLVVSNLSDRLVHLQRVLELLPANAQSYMTSVLTAAAANNNGGPQPSSPIAPPAFLRSNSMNSGMDQITDGFGSLRLSNSQNFLNAPPALLALANPPAKPHADEEALLNEPEVKVSGFLYLQFAANIFKKVWCEYRSGVLTFRTAPNVGDVGSINVTYIDNEYDPTNASGSSATVGSAAGTTSPIAPTQGNSPRTAGSIFSFAFGSGGGTLNSAAANAAANALNSGPNSSTPQQTSPIANAATFTGGSSPRASSILASVFPSLLGNNGGPNPSESSPSPRRSPPASVGLPNSPLQDAPGTPPVTSGGGIGTPNMTPTHLARQITPQLPPLGSLPPSIGPPKSHTHSKADDIYCQYLESVDGKFCIDVFSPNRMYLFRAESEEMRSKFVQIIRKDLESVLPPYVWIEKNQAFREIHPLIREQTVYQNEKLNTLIATLSKSGLRSSQWEDVLPITSLRKDKSGVLSMESQNEKQPWKDFYFVLFEGALYYYKDSKSTTPTGFILLRHASIYLDPKRLSKGEYVFKVKTPLRTFICKSKHSVALSEWITSLEAVVTAKSSKPSSKLSLKVPPKVNRKKSIEVLQNINDIIADVSTLDLLIAHPLGSQFFREWLSLPLDSKTHLPRSESTENVSVSAAAEAERSAAENKQREEKTDYVALLDFFQEVENFRNSPKDADDISQRADQLYDRFLEEGRGRLSGWLSSDLRKSVDSQLSTPSPSMFDSVRNAILPILTERFSYFKESNKYAELNAQLDREVEYDKRVILKFDSNMQLAFLLKVKGVKKSREIKLKKGQNVLTIGRDKSNHVVLDDSRVSRSHARIEYSDTHCEYIDLGSSCGSKLNGRPVFRAKLRSGDFLELGQSILIFQLKKKPRFSLF